MADLKERIKVWKDYIKEHHNEYIKESLEGVDDEDLDDARKDLFDFIQNDVTNKFGDKNNFRQKIDELNQETETLIDEIEKWQT